MEPKIQYLKSCKGKVILSNKNVKSTFHTTEILRSVSLAQRDGQTRNTYLENIIRNATYIGSAEIDTESNTESNMYYVKWPLHNLVRATRISSIPSKADKSDNWRKKEKSDNDTSDIRQKKTPVPSDTWSSNRFCEIKNELDEEYKQGECPHFILTMFYHH